MFDCSPGWPVYSNTRQRNTIIYTLQFCLQPASFHSKQGLQKKRRTMGMEGIDTIGLEISWRRNLAAVACAMF